MKKFKVILDYLQKLALRFSMCLIFFMMVFVSLDAILRYTFNAPLPASFEISCILLVLITSFAFATAQKLNRNITIELILDHLHPKTKEKLQFVWLLVMAFSVSLLGWYIIASAFEAWKTNLCTYGVVKIPLWPSKLALGIAFFLLFLTIIYQIKEKWTLLPNKENKR